MSDEHRAPRQPWMRTKRRVLPARGRQRAALSIVVVVYRDTVWLSVEPSSASDVAIFEPPQVDDLIALLTWAAGEARRTPES
jgi:hypothetical protein